MSIKNHYFKIGLFIIIGTVLLLIGLIIFGAGNLFKDEILFETYFDSSVQGLDIGSPVKYRGVTIGEVKEIGVVDSYYNLRKIDQDKFKKYGLYVLVTFAVSTDVFSLFETRDLQDELNTLIEKRGLRLRLSYLGITGLAYLEIDFFDSEKNPILGIAWQPKHYYIPSVPNTIQLISNSLSDLSKAITADFIPLLENISQSSETFPEFMVNLNETMTSLRDTLAKINVSANDFPKITAHANETLFHINQMLRGERYNIEEILNNLRLITEDLKDVSERLQISPAQVLFSEASPPLKIDRE